MVMSRVLVPALVCVAAVAGASAQDGTVKAHQKLSGLEGGMQGVLTPVTDSFGHDVQLLEDLDGDGIRELAVGGPGCDDGGNARGSIWILFLDPDGTVRQAQKISQTSGGFVGSLGHGSDGDQLGVALASLGDLDGDGIGDLAAGTNLDDGSFDTQTSCGSVWIVRLNADGTVKAQQKIDEDHGGFVGDLPAFGHFGRAVEGLGDLDGDGVGDLAVSMRQNGQVHILFLATDGTVSSQGVGFGFGEAVDFGCSLAWLGDLDGDGVGELAVGARNDDNGGPNRGAVFIVFLRTDGSMKGFQKISSTLGGFTGVLTDQAQFGYSASPAGDVNGDGVIDDKDVQYLFDYIHHGGPAPVSYWAPRS